MLLYVESERYGKQVLVAFDKHLSYTAETQRRLKVTRFSSLARARHHLWVGMEHEGRKGRGGNVQTDVLVRICETLVCDITDIVEVVEGEGA